MPEDKFSACPPPPPGEATIGSRPLFSFLPSFSRGEEWTKGEARRQWKTLRTNQASLKKGRRGGGERLPYKSMVEEEEESPSPELIVYVVVFFAPISAGQSGGGGSML